MTSTKRNIISFFKKFMREPLGVMGGVIVLAMVFSAIGADFLVPYDPSAMDIRARLADPSWAHLLGTDHLGRDVFSRILMGGRIALWVALVSIGVSLIIGVILGLIAGYGPRWLDNTLVLIFDAVRSFPTIMLALAMVTLLGSGLNTIIFVVIVTSIPAYGRVVRTQTQALKHNEFILAEKAQGAGMARVLIVHMIPNVIGPLLIIASMDIPVVITIEAGLSFLGLGVKPPTPSWGSILYDGYSFIRNTPWLIIAGGLPLILTTLGFTFLGEALRDIFDPKLQKNG